MRFTPLTVALDRIAGISTLNARHDTPPDEAIGRELAPSNGRLESRIGDLENAVIHLATRDAFSADRHAERDETEARQRANPPREPAARRENLNAAGVAAALRDWNLCRG